MRHEILPDPPGGLIPPRTVRACLRSVLVVGATLSLAVLVLSFSLIARALPAAYGADLNTRAELNSRPEAQAMSSGPFAGSGNGSQGPPAAQFGSAPAPGGER